MKEIVANVAANAALYENIEVQLHMKYNRVSNVIDLPPERNITSQSATIRCVYQDGKIFFRQELRNCMESGATGNEDMLLGYDGQSMRNISQGLVANIRDDRKEDERFVRPHTLPMYTRVGCFPLAEILKGGRSARKCRGYAESHVNVAYDGVEMIDGMRCHRVKLTSKYDHAPRERGPAVQFLWLAPERNYLLIRIATYPSLAAGPGVTPVEVGHAQDVREISPGIWFPFRVDIIQHNLMAETHEGNKSLHDAYTFSVDKAELDPHYDINLFRDIPFPDGAVVYVVNNGKIAKSYVQGGRNVQRPASRRGAHFVAGGLGALCAAVLLWFAWRR